MITAEENKKFEEVNKKFENPMWKEHKVRPTWDTELKSWKWSGNKKDLKQCIVAMKLRKPKGGVITPIKTDLDLTNIRNRVFNHPDVFIYMFDGARNLDISTNSVHRFIYFCIKDPTS